MDFNKFTRPVAQKFSDTKGPDEPATYLELRATAAAAHASLDLSCFLAEILIYVQQLLPEAHTKEARVAIAEYEARVSDMVEANNNQQGEYGKQVVRQRLAAAKRASPAGEPDRADAPGETHAPPLHVRGSGAIAAWIEAYSRGFAAGIAAGRSGGAPSADHSERAEPGLPHEEGKEARQPGGLGNSDAGPRRAVRRARKGGADPEGDGS
jgi:hypothetical protein